MEYNVFKFEIKGRNEVVSEDFIGEIEVSENADENEFFEALKAKFADELFIRYADGVKIDWVTYETGNLYDAGELIGCLQLPQWC